MSQIHSRRSNQRPERYFVDDYSLPSQAEGTLLLLIIDYYCLNKVSCNLEVLTELFLFDGCFCRGHFNCNAHSLQCKGILAEKRSIYFDAKYLADILNL